MPKSSVVQLVLIIVGIIAAYTGVQYLLSNFVYSFVHLLESSTEGMWRYSLVTLLITGAYLLCAYFLISHSKKWSQALVSKSGLGDFSITAQPVQILYFLLVGISAYALIKAMPPMLVLLYDSFASKVDHTLGPTFEELAPNWTTGFLNLLLPALLLVFAGPLSVRLAKKLDEASITIEETTAEGI